MAPSDDILFAFSHKTAKRLVDLEVLTLDVFEPDQVGGGIDGGFQVVLQQRVLFGAAMRRAADH